MGDSKEEKRGVPSRTKGSTSAARSGNSSVTLNS